MSHHYDENHVDKDDLAAYLSDNRLWVETYERLGLFGEAARGYQPGAKAPKIACPLHGGITGEAFGFMAKGKLRSHETGAGVCNTCGVINGYKLVMTETGWSFPETLEQLAIASGYKDGITRGHFHVREKSPEQLAREAAAKKRQEEMDSKTLAKNKAWWNEAFSLNKPQAQPAILYFKNRGLAARVAALGDEVRLHPGIRYYDITHTACVITQEGEGFRKFWIDKDGVRLEQPLGKELDTHSKVMSETVPLDHRIAEPARKLLEAASPAIAEYIRQHNPVFHKGIGYINDLGVFPCILTRIRNPSGLPVSLHQTYITSDGHKASVPSAKKLRPAISSLPISGGAAQLCPPAPILGVGEGIETVLSVETAIGMPVWPLLNATLMASWIPPKGTRHVYQWEDPDPAGQLNGEKLAERLISMGISVTRCNPASVRPEGDYDWNDVLMHMGADVFPHHDWLERL